ncbi:Ferrichrome-iron receptor precursor [Pseudoruegeria aquimaris]|uniref:Ferrichrome-iron receptor n=1 Tax=Pseudoruegeria aquimaris TaxID=393663 RepID=A0A1Y5TSI5_9RHOB|nr:TonB-dependent siderophore receptor [Pseudoruegeria aquimaris]SLN67213.1 Ferrichrome-iron receptor precursor [Pseudoruegeria aquimaris]
MFFTRAAVSVCALVAAMPALAQEIIELEQITIEGQTSDGFFGESVATNSGTIMKTGDPIAETPRSVSVFTEQQIQQRGARTVEDALKYTVGVTAGQWGVDARSDWSLVRGFSPTTLHDGLPARYGYYNDTTPEPFMLNSVSVLRGPASGLYGSGSVGGVVNTTSKTAAQDAPNLWQLQVGSFDRVQGALDVSGDLNESGTLRYRFVGVARDSETQVDHSQDDVLALAPSITWRPSEATELTVLANYQKSDRSPLIQFASIYGTLLPATGFGNGDYLPNSLFVGEPEFDKFESEQRSITAMFKHRFNPVWSMNANFRYLEGEAEYQHAWWAFDNFGTGRYNPDGTINRTFYRAENELKTLALDTYATAEYALGEVQMRSILGASYSRGTYDSDFGYGAQVAPIDPFNPVYTGFNPITVTDTPGTSVDEWGLYAQNRATYDRWVFDFGLRYGGIETGASNGSFGATTAAAEDSKWTGNAAVMYLFDNGLAPYLSYATSFQQDAIGTDVNGNAFDPTEGEQIELGVKYQPAGTATLLSAAVFDLTKSNLLVADPVNPGFQVQTGEASSRGFEFEAYQSFGDVSVQAAYTYLDTENAAGFEIAQVPEHAASLWVNYAPKRLRGWQFGGGVRYNGAAWDGVGIQETPAYTLFDTAIAYEQDNWRLALNVSNLTDERYVTTCQSGSCYFGEGRNVALTLTSTF